MEKTEAFTSIVAGKSLYIRHINANCEKDSVPLLIFLHEGLGSDKQWKGFPDALCQNLNVRGLVYERYGYANSQPLSGKRNNEYMHNEAFMFLPALIRKMNINKKVILVGHSDGGTIALLYAAAFPDKVAGIVTMAAHSFVEDITIKGIEKAVLAYENKGLREALSKYHGDNTDIMFYGWANAWLHEMANSWSIIDFLPDIQCPVLAIQGDCDPYGSKAQIDVISEKIGDKAHIKLVQGCGHSPHIECPELVKRMIVDFLRQAELIH